MYLQRYLLHMAQDGTVMSLDTSDRGFGLRKEVAEKDGEHVQLDLEITSTYDSESVVTVEESVPPGTDHSQIGFLPNHEPEEWDLSDDGTLLLTARLVPDGTREIIYGLREIEPAEADPLGNEPRVVDVGGPAAEAVPEPDREPGVDAAPADAGPGAGGDVAASGAETDGGAGAESAAETLATPLDEETAADLATAIEPHLDVGAGEDPVTETKLSQLQEDVADMRAYLPAFEEFLGESGRADDILSELEAINEQVQDLEALENRIEELEGGPEDLQATIDDVEERLTSIEETVATVDERSEAVDERLQSVDDRVETMATRLSGLEDWRESIAAVSRPETAGTEDDDHGANESPTDGTAAEADQPAAEADQPAAEKDQPAAEEPAADATE
jgi:archaellum component FlaC